jgi:hypothetical protein
MFFGKKLKELRIKHAKQGLRRFSDTVDMCPSQYSEMERGIVPPPPCKKWIYGIIDILGLKHDDPEAIELYDLWGEPFVMQKMRDDGIVSPLAHKSDGTPLTKDEYLKLNEYINSIGREHNKIADGYNKERYGEQGKI